MQIRSAEIQHAAAIVGVINAAFRNAESFLIDGDRVTLELVTSLLQKGQFLVADDNGSLAGCVYVELRGDRAYLGLLSVDPQRQKAGLGSMLMDAAEEYCVKSGCHFLDLRIVNVRRELPGFYQRHGYAEVGTSLFPAEAKPKVPCHFIEMSKRLT